MKAYRYSRVSGLKQASDGQGLERQSDMIGEWLKRHPEVEIDTEFTFKDAGKSAFKGKHLEKGASLALFLSAVESGLIQTPCYLIIEMLDRLVRMPPLEARDKVVHPLLNKGVTIVTVSDGREYSKETVNDSSTGASIMLELFLGMAYTYSKNLSNRVQDAKKRQRTAAGESGKIFTAMCPFWLRVVEANGEKRFEEIPEAVAIVKRVFNERINERKSLFRIAADLNREGVPLYTHHHARKGKPLWSSASLSTLLKNESVTGLLRESQHLDSNGNPKYPAVTGYYPQVIDFVTFDKAKLAARQGKPPSQRLFPAATNIFRGYIRCKHCGKLCTINGVRPDFAGSITCRSSREGLCFDSHGVKTPTFSMNKFEDAVFNYLFATLSKSETNNGVQEVIASLNQELRVNRQSQSNFEEGISQASNPTVINILVKKLEEVTVKIEDAQNKLLSLQRQLTKKSKFTLEGLDMGIKADREKARDVISEHIQDIVIDLHNKTLDVTLRNGNGIKGFNLLSPADNNIQLQRMIVPDDFIKDVDFVIGS